MAGKIPKKEGAQAESEREAWGEGIPARIKVGKGAGVCYVCVCGGGVGVGVGGWGAEWGKDRKGMLLRVSKPVVKAAGRKWQR